MTDRFADGAVNRVVYHSTTRMWHDLRDRFLLSPAIVQQALQRGVSARAPRVYASAAAGSSSPTTTVHDFGQDTAALAAGDPDLVVYGGSTLDSMPVFDAQFSAGTEPAPGFDWSNVSTVIYSSDPTGTDPNAYQVSISTASATSDWGAAYGQFYNPASPDVIAGGLAGSVPNEYTLVTRIDGAMVGVSTTWQPSAAEWTTILSGLETDPTG